MYVCIFMAMHVDKCVWMHVFSIYVCMYEQNIFININAGYVFLYVNTRMSACMVILMKGMCMCMYI